MGSMLVRGELVGERLRVCENRKLYMARDEEMRSRDEGDEEIGGDMRKLENEPSSSRILEENSELPKRGCGKRKGSRR